MFFHPVLSPGLSPGFFKSVFKGIIAVAIGASLTLALPARASAQSYEKEITVGEKPTLTIKNRNGRVSVITSADQKDKAMVRATSPGAPVEAGDVNFASGEITVRERRAQDRIDLTIHVPERTRVKIESESGMVDVIGDLAFAEVATNTGTIHADVPLDAVKFKFLWQASHPRFLSDVELPRIKEGKAGTFSISGTRVSRRSRNSTCRSL